MDRIKEVYKGQQAIAEYGVNSVIAEEKGKEALKYSLGAYIKLPKKEGIIMTKPEKIKRKYQSMTKEQKELCMQHLRDEITFKELKEKTGLSPEKLSKKMYNLRAKHQIVVTKPLYDVKEEKDTIQEAHWEEIKTPDDKTQAEFVAIVIEDSIECKYDSGKITEAKAVKDYISSKNTGDIVKLYIMTEIE